MAEWDAFETSQTRNIAPVELNRELTTKTFQHVLIDAGLDFEKIDEERGELRHEVHTYRVWDEENDGSDAIEVAHHRNGLLADSNRLVYDEDITDDVRWRIERGVCEKILHEHLERLGGSVPPETRDDDDTAVMTPVDYLQSSADKDDGHEYKRRKREAAHHLRAALTRIDAGDFDELYAAVDRYHQLSRRAVKKLAED